MYASASGAGHFLTRIRTHTQCPNCHDKLDPGGFNGSMGAGGGGMGSISGLGSYGNGGYRQMDTFNLWTRLISLHHSEIALRHSEIVKRGLKCRCASTLEHWKERKEWKEYNDPNSGRPHKGRGACLFPHPLSPSLSFSSFSALGADRLDLLPWCRGLMSGSLGAHEPSPLIT